MAKPGDWSHLDRRYFIDQGVYNCPFCNRRNVQYKVNATYSFDWTSSKKCYVCFVVCDWCLQVSMHFSFDDIVATSITQDRRVCYYFKPGIDIDAAIFYSVPTSFFVLDERVPAVLRALITEAEGCRKMNFLTGASACARKAIYELLVLDNAEGEHYQDRIKSLKSRYPSVDAEIFDVLAQIQDMTSDKVHEQSWPHWSSENLALIIETLKTVLYEVYVLPAEKAERSSQIQQLRQKVLGKTQDAKPVVATAKQPS